MHVTSDAYNMMLTNFSHAIHLWVKHQQPSTHSVCFSKLFLDCSDHSASFEFLPFRGSSRPTMWIRGLFAAWFELCCLAAQQQLRDGTSTARFGLGKATVCVE